MPPRRRRRPRLRPRRWRSGGRRRAAAATDLARLQAGGEGQLSRTDPDARRLGKNGRIVAGYNGQIVAGHNVQIAVDDKHKPIPAFARTASAVVNDGNDTGQLGAMAKAAKAALGAATPTVVADTGYYNGETLKECEEAAITADTPPPDRDRRLKSQGRFSLEEFHYHAAADRSAAGSRIPDAAAFLPSLAAKPHPTGTFM